MRYLGGLILRGVAALILGGLTLTGQILVGLIFATLMLYSEPDRPRMTILLAVMIFGVCGRLS